MDKRAPITLDMAPDGSFRPVPVRAANWPLRLGLVALGVSFVTGLVAVAALLFYLALILLPVAIGAGVVAYLSWRFSLWRGRRGTGRAIFRP